MSIFLQVFINGILFGTMYGVAAIGLSVIFGTMRIIFLAQGTMIVLFAYLVYWLHELLNVDPYLSALIVIPVSLARRPRTLLPALQEGLGARGQERVPAARGRADVHDRQPAAQGVHREPAVREDLLRGPHASTSAPSTSRSSA